MARRPARLAPPSLAPGRGSTDIRASGAASPARTGPLERSAGRRERMAVTRAHRGPST